MAKVVNVHRVDDETFYLVRLTPQEIAPLLPAGLDAENLPEGQVFVATDPWAAGDYGDEAGCGTFVAEDPAPPSDAPEFSSYWQRRKAKLMADPAFRTAYEEELARIRAAIPRGQLIGGGANTSRGPDADEA